MKKNGKYCSGKKSMNMKPLAVLLALTLLLGCAVGGTLAWLTANSTPVTNTFTESNIAITLDEDKPTDKTAKMVPGWKIDKDPYVTVDGTSEDCYLFIKVIEDGGNITVDGESYTFDDFIKYTVKTGEGHWTALDETKYPGVYYKVIDTAAEKGVDAQGDAVKHIILGEGSETYEGTAYSWADNQVLTIPTVTKEMMNAINESNRPSLSFNAYAVQLWKSNKPADLTDKDAVEAAQFSAEDAWKKTPGYTTP